MPRPLLSELVLRGRNKSIHQCKIWALILKEEIILAGQTQDIPSYNGLGATHIYMGERSPRGGHASPWARPVAPQKEQER